MKWGEYVGSPSAPVPVVCFSQPHGERFGSLQALPTRAICGLSRNFCLLMTYNKEQGNVNHSEDQTGGLLEDLTVTSSPGLLPYLTSEVAQALEKSSLQNCGYLCKLGIKV